MANFQGTDGNDSILRNFLSAGVTAVPAFTGTLTGEDNYIDGGRGNDTIEAGDGGYGDEVHGGAGNDTITGGAGADSLYGDDGNDVIWGGAASYFESYDGGAGNDVIHASDNGFNVIDGGTGADKMYGGAFDDVFSVDNVRDRVIEATSSGFDTVNATIQRYTLTANIESLHFESPEGDQDEFGTGNRLDNEIVTQDGNDRLFGQGGNDLLDSRAGSDELRGGEGNDWLDAGEGNDRLFGGSGRDTLLAGEGADRLVGGTGRDTFYYWDVSHSTPTQRDVIAAGDGAIAFQGAGRATGDVFDLREMDADLTTRADESFIFGGTGKGHLSLVDLGADTLVRGNLDDDAAFEFQILIEDGSVRASAYTADDFLLTYT